MTSLHSLWRDDTGAILSSELILIMTILVIGLVTGLAAVRTAVLTELGDIANAIGVLNQSYSFGAATHCCGSVAGSFFTDIADQCDETSTPAAPSSNPVAACETVTATNGG